MLVPHLDPNGIRGSTLHPEQSVSRQIRCGAHDLDFGGAKAADLGTNLVAAEI
jgi:hypothetical protein